MSKDKAEDSNFLLSEASDSNRELSFSDTTVLSPPAPGKAKPTVSASPQRSAKPAGDVPLPKWGPTGKLAPPKPTAAVTTSDDEELSFTAVSPSVHVQPHQRQAGGGKSPAPAENYKGSSLRAERSHIASLEDAQRNHLLDEECYSRQHLARQLIIQAVKVEEAVVVRKKKEREQLAAARAANNAAVPVAPAVMRYKAHLESKPESDEVAQFREERMRIARQLVRRREVAENLSNEVNTRKAYTKEVTSEVQRQEYERALALHERLQAAADEQKRKIDSMKQEKLARMENEKQKKLDKLRYQYAYVTLHGNYESKMEEGDALKVKRLIELNSVGPAVRSRQTNDEIETVAQIQQRIKQEATERRQAALALAEQLKREQEERSKVIEMSTQETDRQRSKLEERDAREFQAAREAFQRAKEDLESYEREQERSIFLSRMTANETFNLEIERLRQKRKEEEKSLWEERRKAEKEKQELAQVAAGLDKQNKAKENRLDHLMAEEAVVVQRANRRLKNRLKVEKRQEERMLLMENDVMHKRKMLDAIYSGAISAPAAANGGRTSTSADTFNASRSKTPSKTHNVDFSTFRSLSAPLTLVTGDGPHDAVKSEQPNEAPSAAKAKQPTLRDMVLEEEMKKRHIAATQFPRRTRVLEPIQKPLKPEESLAFPTPSLLKRKHLPTDNPKILELAQRLIELEGGRAGQSESSIDSAERERIRVRLTERSTAQDAQKFSHVEDTREPTIHDNIPPQHGVNARLYNAATKGYSPSRFKEPEPIDRAAPWKKNIKGRASPARRKERSGEDDDDDDLTNDTSRPGLAQDPALENFVNRFFEGPLKRHERVLETATSKIMTQVEADMRHPPKVATAELANILDRLYTSEIHHLSPERERILEERQNASGKKIDRSEAAERFYAKPLEKQRELLKKLDEQYLSR